MTEGAQSALLDELHDSGYKNCRALADGTIVGLVDLLFTRAIVIGLDGQSYDKRFCFSNREEADRQLMTLVDEHSEPINYIARRGQGSFCEHGLMMTQCESCRPSWIASPY